MTRPAGRGYVSAGPGVALLPDLLDDDSSMSPSSAYLRYQVRLLAYLALPTRPYPRTCTFIVFFRLCSC
jgi:hypothetical protein